MNAVAIPEGTIIDDPARSTMQARTLPLLHSHPTFRSD